MNWDFAVEFFVGAMIAFCLLAAIWLGVDFAMKKKPVSAIITGVFGTAVFSIFLGYIV